MRKIYTREEIATLLKDVFQNSSVKRAVLFGSYATGCADAGSDVDLCVECDLHGLDFIALIEDIREALLKDADVVRMSEVVEGSRLDSEIKKDGVVIYEG